MARVVRLVTVADVGADADADPRRLSVSASHAAVLDDGSRVVLLDDRGWAQSVRGAGADDVPDIWAMATKDEIADTARVVVGPDEPDGGRSQSEMEAGHWSTLAEVLRAHGVFVDAEELSRLPHDVVLSDALLARLGREAD